MALPDWMKNKTWQWIIGTIIAIAAIVIPLALTLTKSTNPPANINQTLNINGDKNISTQISNSPGTTVIIKNVDPEESAKLDAILQNTKKLLKEKGYEATQPLLDDLKEKYQKVVRELNEYKTKDKRAEDALVAFKDGNYEKAKELFETQREEEKKKEGEHAETAYNLGNVYFVELDFQEALRAYLDAVRLAPDNSTYLNEAGSTFNTLAQYDKAIEYYEKALKTDLKTFGEDHPNVATRWNNLGLAWRAKGEYDKAIEYYEKSLMSILKTFGEDHPNVATSWNNLGGGLESKR